MLSPSGRRRGKAGTALKRRGQTATSAPYGPLETPSAPGRHAPRRRPSSGPAPRAGRPAPPRSALGQDSWGTGSAPCLQQPPMASAYRGQLCPIKCRKVQSVLESLANRRRLRQHTRPDPEGTSRSESLVGPRSRRPEQVGPAGAMSQTENLLREFRCLNYTIIIGY